MLYCDNVHSKMYDKEISANQTSSKGKYEFMQDWGLIQQNMNNNQTGPHNYCE